MEQSFLIEGDEASGLAEELARRRGETVAAAVTAALREALERDQTTLKQADDHAQAEERYLTLAAIAAEIHKNLKRPLPSSDHSWLYDDETGLPK